MSIVVAKSSWSECYHQQMRQDGEHKQDCEQYPGFREEPAGRKALIAVQLDALLLGALGMAGVAILAWRYLSQAIRSLAARRVKSTRWQYTP